MLVVEQLPVMAIYSFHTVAGRLQERQSSKATFSVAHKLFLKSRNKIERLHSIFWGKVKKIITLKLVLYYFG